MTFDGPTQAIRCAEAVRADAETLGIETRAGIHTAMDKVKVSRAAASLVASGLLRQAQDPQDGRGRLLRLTRKGAALYADVAPTASEIQDVLMAGLGRTEWRALHRALGKLSDHAQSLLDMPAEGEA